MNVADAVSAQKDSSKNQTIFHDSAQKPGRLFSVAALSLVNRFFNIFKKEAAASVVDVKSKHFFKSVRSEIALSQNKYR